MNKTKRRSRKKKSTTRKKRKSFSKVLSIPSFTFSTKNKELKIRNRSYTPSFYKKMTRLKTSTPLKSIIGSKSFICNDDEIYYSKTKKCYAWNTKKGKSIALKNLNSKKKFNIKDIVGPKQVLGNCWLNCFFVIYFISDKGHKFNRYLRQSMITGKNIDGRPIKRKLHRLMFIFNKFIESSIRGRHSAINRKYALKMDTNVLIKEIYKNIPNVNKRLVPNVNEAGNMEEFYEGMMHYFNLEKKVRKYYINKIDIYEHLIGKRIDNLDMVHFIHNDIYNSHIIVLKIADSDFQNILSNIYFSKRNLKKLTEIKIKDRVFKLDSAALLDNDGNHFSAYITVNNKSCMFEGYSYARIVPFEWKKKLNTKKSWKTFKSRVYEDNFNCFMKGYQLLYYYRN